MVDVILVAAVFGGLVALIAFLWMHRRKLHSNMTFTAETVFHDFQADEGRAAIVQHQFDKDEEIKEASGEQEG